MAKQTRDPARTALALAIDAKAKASQNAVVASASLAKLETLIERTTDDLAAARDDIKRETDAAVMRSIGNGGDVIDRVDATLHMKETELADRLASALAMRPKCMNAKDEADAAWEAATGALAEAAKAVERSAVTAMIAEAEALQRELFRRRQVLVRLANGFPTINHYGSFRPSDEAAELRRFLQDDTLPTINDSLERTVGFAEAVALAEAPWKAYRAALLTNPDAEAPAW